MCLPFYTLVQYQSFFLSRRSILISNSSSKTSVRVFLEFFFYLKLDSRRASHPNASGKEPIGCDENTVQFLTGGAAWRCHVFCPQLDESSRVVYSALTQFWNAAVGIALVWLELWTSHFVRISVRIGAWETLVWKQPKTATSRDLWMRRADVSTRQVWPKGLPMDCFSLFRKCVTELTNENFLEKQNDEGASQP